MSNHTPLMQQYHDIKAEHADSLLMFQVGDFYELFFEDAKVASSFLGIALTARGKNKGEPIPLCGVPMHARDHYVNKLVRGGFKVALCDQLEPPRPGEVVKRGVTQVLTPGTLTDAQLLDDKSASYLLSFFPIGDSWGLLFGEVLTAQLFATVISSGSDRTLESELSRFFPKEVLVPDAKDARRFQSLFRSLGYFTTPVPNSDESADESIVRDEWVKKQFNADVGDVLNREQALLKAVHAFYAYMQHTNKNALGQFRTIQFYDANDFLMLDSSTQRNLEIVKNSHDGGRKNTLLSVLDRARTPMGSRMVRKWLLRPLITQDAINQRLDVVERFIAEQELTLSLGDLLHQVGDIERVVGRIALNRATIHDYRMLTSALSVLPNIQSYLAPYVSLALLRVILGHMPDFRVLHDLLYAAINDDSSKDWKIKSGFDEQLDQLRDLIANSSRKIVDLERNEQELTGISSLKVRYNNVHGYYIEVTKANMHLVPDRYVRQQTLAGRERYTTPELRELQHEITSAHTRVSEVEAQVFERVKKEISAYVVPLRKCAHALAHIDALYSFAICARDNGYVRPTFNENREFHVKHGRHPVIEQCVDGCFIPNDVDLDDTRSLWIITGPNMGGKSTFLRQSALIAIQAHCGSFVSAEQADICLFDRIFSRIGAGDNLAQGKSTFLVEMEETAAICTQATEKSLVILDEVGRGTSTFDGLAIAQAVVEYLYTTIKARCLFATHYHEITQLQVRYDGIVSYFASSAKKEDGILFLYKMVQGIADGSFGIEVARLADIPGVIIDRSRDIVSTLAQEQGRSSDKGIIPLGPHQDVSDEIAQIKKERDRLKDRYFALERIDYDNLSPRQAFDLVWSLREKC